MHVSGIGWVRLVARSADVVDVSVFRSGKFIDVKMRGIEAGDDATISLDADLWDKVVTALQSEKVSA